MAEGDAVTFIRPGDDHWAHGIVGSDGEALSDENAHALNEFETPQDFANQFFTARDADWRAPIAGEDKKFLSELQRYSTPGDLGNSWREQKQTISAGQYSKPLSEDATDDDIAAYREANGIPAEPAGYLKGLPDGVVIGEDDKVHFESLMGALHEENAPPSIANKIIGWYNGFAEQQQDAQHDLDNAQSTEANDTLRADWGADYRANINLVNGLIASTFGQEAADQLLNGRYQDGKAFMNDPAVLKGFAEIARQINPVMALSTPGTDATTTMNDEIEQLEKYMSEKRTEYNKDEKAQARLRKLYDIRIQQAAA